MNTTTNTAARELPSNDHLRLHLGEMTAQEMRTAKAAYRLALTETLTQQQGGEQEAGELLARFDTAEARSDMLIVSKTAALNAITAALRTKQPAASEGDGLSRIHAMFRALGFDGLEALPGWGWSYSRSGCAVEAMIENGILLEHFDDWVGFRPSANTSKQAAGEAVPIGWFTDDHLTDRSATTYDKTVADRWVAKGWPITPIYTTPPRHPADEENPT